MPELVRDVADGVALVVEAGGDGLAEDVAADPGVAGPVERLAQVGLRVGRVADQPGGRGEDDPGGSRWVVGQLAPLEHPHQVWRQVQDSFRSGGLGAWLDLQP